MGRVKTKVTTQKERITRKSIISIPSTEERIKIIANLIIDKILEDQRNGILQAKRVNNQQT